MMGPTVTAAISEPQRKPGSRQALEAALRAALHADVDVEVPDAEHEGLRFRHYLSDSIGVIETVADRPMRAANGISPTAQAYVICLKRGQLRLSYEGGVLSLKAGQFVVFPSRHALTLFHETASTVLGVCVPDAVLSRWLPDWHFAQFLPLSDDGAEGRLAFDIAEGLLNTGPRLQARNAVAVGSMVSRLLADSLATLGNLGPSQCVAEFHRRRARQFCRSHLGSDQLSIESIAAALALSKPYLHRLFKDETLTLKAWIQVQRLEAAKALIEDDLLAARSLTDIALEGGFKDVSHFSHAFRSHYGSSPREFRAQLLALHHRSGTGSPRSLPTSGQTLS